MAEQPGPDGQSRGDRAQVRADGTHPIPLVEPGPEDHFTRVGAFDGIGHSNTTLLAVKMNG